MNLKDWIAEKRGRASALAAELKISPAHLSQITADSSSTAPARCVAIEQGTDGHVRRWDLRPTDWYLIWPELIGQPGAPATPTEPELTK